jgi:tetratricopeptide (TPR) repeat protein
MAEVDNSKQTPEGGNKTSLGLTIILFGILFVAGAIVGGGIKGQGFELPSIVSSPQRWGLGLFGGALLLAGSMVAGWPQYSPSLKRRWKQSQSRRRARWAARQPLLEVPMAAKPLIGRDEELVKLHQRLNEGQRVSLTGLGGVGKTRLAQAYASKRREDYPNGVFWLRGDTPSGLVGDFAALAARHVLPEANERDKGLVVAAVQRWLRAEPNQHWLLVVDNLEEEAFETLNDLVDNQPGAVLVTSRFPRWGSAVELGVLSLPQSVDFLAQRTGQADTVAAEATAEELGRLPLALEQAAAYMIETGESLAGYRKRLAKNPAHLLDWLPALPAEAAQIRAVARTWTASFDRVQEASAAAADLLRLCAFLGPDEIPVDLLVDGTSAIQGPLGIAIAADGGLNAAIAVLLRYSLMYRQTAQTSPIGVDSLNVHRLVQAVVRSSIKSSMQEQWADTAWRVLREAIPADTGQPPAWQKCAQLLPHVLAMSKVEAPTTELRAMSLVLNETAIYLHARAEYSAAQSLFEGALGIHERLLGPDHPQTATILNNLALLLQDKGDLEAARPLCERALGIRERVLGPDHLDTASSLNSLASLLQGKGELEAARPLFERALDIDERVLGPDHPVTASSLNNLALLLQDKGELEAARPLYERSLDIRERVLGPDHPRTANSLNNLAALLQLKGQIEAARPLYERALGIRERVQGPDHPETARSLGNLATLLRAKDELEAARPLYERALRIDERVLGPDHPDTATSLNNLALLLQDKGELEAARPLYERSLDIRERVLGPDHPDTAQVRKNLAGLTRMTL